MPSRLPGWILIGLCFALANCKPRRIVVAPPAAEYPAAVGPAADASPNLDESLSIDTRTPADNAKAARLIEHKHFLVALTAHVEAEAARRGATFTPAGLRAIQADLVVASWAFSAVASFSFSFTASTAYLTLEAVLTQYVTRAVAEAIRQGHPTQITDADVASARRLLCPAYLICQ